MKRGNRGGRGSRGSGQNNRGGSNNSNSSHNDRNNNGQYNTYSQDDGYNNQSSNRNNQNNNSYNNTGYNDTNYNDNYNEGNNNRYDNHNSNKDYNTAPDNNSNNSNQNHGNYNRKKNDPFAKNTHSNQQYKKREYTKKNYVPQDSTPKYGSAGGGYDYNEYDKDHNRIHGKILDIEIRQEDEENQDKINEMREIMRNADYTDQIKGLDEYTDNSSKLTNTNSNVLHQIISKNEKLLNNPDMISGVVEILGNNKSDEEIQQDFFDLMGYDDFDTIAELIQNRKEIKELIGVVKSIMEEDEKAKSYNALPNSNLSIEVMDKKKKKHSDMEKMRNSNLKVLQQLGFSERFVRENQMLGLKEKKLPENSVFKQKLNEKAFLQPSTQGAYITDIKSTFKNHIEIKVKPLILDRKQVNKVRVEEMPKWAQKAFNFKEFNEIQSTVFKKAYKSDENLLICAPTGAGKTNIALLTIMREISKQLNNTKGEFDGDFSKINWNFKIVYLVPLKALANEIVDKFKTSLSFLNIRVNEFSADVNLTKEQIENTQLFIAIPEKWDLFTRKNDEVFNSLKLMIIDEVHLLNEDRGRVLECIVARTVRKIEINQKFIRIAGLSATLPNYWDVAEFLKVNEGLFNFDASYRATPLKMRFLGVYEKKTDSEYKDVEGQIVFDEIVKYLDKEKQVLIFVHSRAETMNFARDLVNRAQNAYRSDLFTPQKKMKLPKFTNKVLEEIVPYGIGFHNAGLMRKDRNSVEALFANKSINVLVSTSTLAWGVNLPAYAVIIKGVTFYDASKGTLVDMGILDIQQMFGRAGRPQFDTKGVAMIVCPSKKVDYFVNLLKNQIDIESKLLKYLSDSINAEIAIGNILSLDDAVSWLNLTYLSIRIRSNPYNYNMMLKDMKSTGYHDVLRNIASEAFERLNTKKLIRYVKYNGSVHSTELGRIASKYYMSYQSVSNFYENLREDMYDDEFLTLFSKSEEFANLKMYPDEKKELELLAHTFDLTQKNTVTKDATAIPKPIILLQTYLKGGYEFKTSSLHMDTNYIIDNSSRIMRAILEISLHKHLVRTTFLALNYVKLVERRVYPGTTPLWQFTFESNKHFLGKNSSGNAYESKEAYISADICRKIDNSNLGSINDLFNEDTKILSKILNTSLVRVNEAMSIASSLPYFKFDVVAKPITRTILNITITITPLFHWKKRWNHMVEPFWIIVDDRKEIIHYEYYTISMKKAEGEKKGKEKDTVISFAVPYQIEAGAKEANIEKIYSINLISDRWVGVEYSHHIYLNDIEVPQDQDVQTELLDLNPLPLSALNNPDFEKIFSFKFFNPIQTQVFYSCYNTDQNILVGAPTGSGKTVVAELTILRVFNHKPSSKIIYVAPLKSLAKERIRDWEVKLKLLGKKVLELTGDVTPDVNALLGADLLITTPEKWDGVSRNWHHRSYVQKVALVIIDEIHLLGLERGPVLEVIVSRMRFIGEKTKNSVRFVGLSTALANSFDVATWLGIPTNTDLKKPPGLFNFKPAVRPCPVTVHIEGFAERHYCPRMGTMNKPAFNAIKNHSNSKPVLIFVSSRRQTRLTALDLISLCAHDSSESFLRISTEEIRTIVELVKDENLKHTLTFGIGMHHAGLVESDRRIVEDLFYNSSIQILVATSTLAWGVNFPAHLVIIKGTEYYDAKLKSYVDMPITDILQMIGRAGRPQYDDSAVACLFVSQDKKNFYKKFLYEPFPLESTLHKVLHDHIAAEVAAGTLTSKQSCIDYITWTYFFRRLVKNPTYYGLKTVDAKSLNEFLTALVDEVLQNLIDSKCVTLHSDDSLNATLIGYLSSFYYLSYKTAYAFEMTLKASLQVNSLIEILSDAQEFSQLPVRHNEEDLNEALAGICPFEVDHLHLDSPHIKTNLLLQAHLSRLPLPISDYVTDSKLVMDNCIRVLLLMIDITSEKGLLDTTMNLVSLSQMIIQGQWLSQSNFLSLPHFTEEEVVKLKSVEGINYLPELIQVQDKLDSIFDRCKLNFNSYEMKEIKNVLKKIPDIRLSYKCYALDPSTLERVYDKPFQPKQEIQICVSLEKLNSQFENTVAHSRFYKVKSCLWFLIIGNDRTNELLAIKKFSFKTNTKKNLNIALPKVIDDESIQIYLISDSYIGIDQQYPVKLQSINERIMQRCNLVVTKTLQPSSYTNNTVKKGEDIEDYSKVAYASDNSDNEETVNEDEGIIFDNW